MYTSYDFAESLEHERINESDVARVIAAWGDSPDGWGSWEGGFLMLMKDGRYCYLTGWCDTSGWGCQDGASVEYYDTLPAYKTLSGDVNWDLEPADLNVELANSNMGR